MSPTLLSLNDLPPELFPIIASHLPLYATPSTLLSLALANRHISTMALPILFSHLIIKNEKHSLRMINRLLDEPGLGLGVRELHIMSELSDGIRLLPQQHSPNESFDMITGLKKVIRRSLLPNIHTLGIYLTSGWDPMEYSDLQLSNGLGELLSDFWADLKYKCPRMKNLILDNVGDTKRRRWLEDCGLYDFQDLSMLIHWQPLYSGGLENHNNLITNLTVLSSSLHTLSLSQFISSSELYVSPLFTLDFPHLKSLHLYYYAVEDSSAVMAFWRRHPMIERLELAYEADTLVKSYFTDDLDSYFFPNLRYLKADYTDVRILAPVLHRLITLEISASINSQIPYLLRSVIPEGLPSLKGLSISDIVSSDARGNKPPEGSLWYETEDGEFRENIQGDKQAIIHTWRKYFLPSIARGAPNVIEFSIDGSLNKPGQFMDMSSQFEAFFHLERLYVSFLSYNSRKRYESTERPWFSHKARLLASACRSLKSVTDISTVDLPYLSATFRRDKGGDVEEVILRKGCGMQVGREHLAFLT
ncbi:hypothetical protein CPB84DRAFT_1768560 [Gymnopilus junonius]|uniref:Uncharacterized protein n=1 Tax=Gymnopilus junonius TaxID=109634 RepID=A0A9P5TRM1_GYMJU|nr:hypothetical protein CPB84DRAFT_1768560 [Gymnopilus junonius]